MIEHILFETIYENADALIWCENNKEKHNYIKFKMGDYHLTIYFHQFTNVNGKLNIYFKDGIINLWNTKTKKVDELKIRQVFSGFGKQ